MDDGQTIYVNNQYDDYGVVDPTFDSTHKDGAQYYLSPDGTRRYLDDLTTESGVLQQSSDKDAMSYLEELAKTDPAYRELWLQAKLERENTERAQKWYEDYNKNYYVNMVKSLQDAGLNPWLALQHVGSMGTGSLSPAKSFTKGAYDSQVAKNKVDLDAFVKSAQLLGSFMSMMGIMIALL